MKNKIITFTFVIFLLSMLALNVTAPKQDLSESERRKLEGFPVLTSETLFSGELFRKFEKYEMDQMVFRDMFRSIKAVTEFSVFNKYDSNNIFIKDGCAFKMDYPYNQGYVHDMSDKMNKICNTYLHGMNVYYSIIPDKNYFIKDNDKHLFIDYDDMVSILNAEVKNMEYINIFDCLSLDDYYKTDIHWKQENLGKVISKISEKMNFSNDFADNVFEKKVFSPFYGSCYGQAALPVKPDVLIYLTNDTIEKAIVNNYEYAGDDRSSQKVYATDKLGSIDSYNVFLSGATPFIEIQSPKNNSGKELIIFNDSFACSLAPLLLSEYSKITLIDLRYVSYKMLDQLVDFKDQDVLFLYNTMIVNNSNILK